MAELLSFQDALSRILEHARPLERETVSLEQAAGRVTADPARARTDLPPFASSAMDGFAVRAADTPGTLPVVLQVAAGAPAGSVLPVGAASTIATGGAVPEGADAVVPIENVRQSDGRVEVTEEVRTGAHIRPRGGDVREGDTVAGAGTRLGPAQIGALAAAGVDRIAVGRRPRVALLATGSELRPPGETLAAGEIYESNRPMIAAVLEAAGATLEHLPVVPDRERAHRRALERGLEADVLVTSGGVSVGPHDLVRRIAQELGVEEVFWGVAVKPGKPLAFGVRGRTLVFGLPGNPVSSLVGSLLFVRPAVLALQGLADARTPFEAATSAAPLRRNVRRDEFLRARRRLEDDGVVIEPVAGQESHMIVRAASADALVHVPRGEGVIASGAIVRYVAV